jgi:ABC-2 type transport system ATP-binding protein
VLLSSHLLHEVQMIADELVMIGRGRIVAQGTPQELLQDSGTFVRALEADRLVEALQAAGFDPTPVADGFRVEAESVQVGKIAAEHQITLVELKLADGGLEDLFLELTADTQRETYPEGAQA